MDLFDNPFHILKASFNSSKAELMDLAQEQSFSWDEDVCTQAHLTLSKPKSRLEAELSWILDVEPVPFDVDTLLSDFNDSEQVYQRFLSVLDMFQGQMYSFDAKIQAARKLNFINIVKTMCNRFPDRVAKDLAKYIQEPVSFSSCFFVTLSQYVDADFSSLREVFNEQRSNNDYAKITVADWSEAVESFKQEVIQLMCKLLDHMPTYMLIHFLQQMLKFEQSLCLDNKLTYLSPALVAFFDRYEVNATDFFKNQEASLNKSLNQLIVAKLGSNPLFLSNNYYHQTLSLVKTWLEVVTPLNIKSQLLTGKSHRQFNVLAYKLSEFSMQCRQAFSPRSVGLLIQQFGELFQKYPYTAEICQSMDSMSKQMLKIASMDNSPKLIELQPNVFLGILDVGFCLDNKIYYYADVLGVKSTPTNLEVVFQNAPAMNISFSLCAKMAKDIFSWQLLTGVYAKWQKCLQMGAPIYVDSLVLSNQYLSVPRMQLQIAWKDVKFIDSTSSLSICCLNGNGRYEPVTTLRYDSLAYSLLSHWSNLNFSSCINLLNMWAKCIPAKPF